MVITRKHERTCGRPKRTLVMMFQNSEKERARRR